MFENKDKFDRKSIYTKRNKIILWLVLLLIWLSCSLAWSESHDYWPTQAWRTSAPEEQGMNSDILADMISLITKTANSIDSVTVIRNGYIVLDAYFYPFQKDNAHIIHSCTKSITSTLVGIAIDKGYIKNVNQGLLDFFPEITPANMTEHKKNITLENILTMATGLECRDSKEYNFQGIWKMWKSNNWTQYMLDLPMIESPGHNFDYCNGAAYLLSAMIQKSSGMRSLKFAMDNLFSPMGITDVKWQSNPQGIDVGYGQMWLKPHDMAKFGWLFLKKGKWNDNTIVSEEWVNAATKGYLEATKFDKYGYQWWVDNDGYYAAVGYEGQRIFVVPKHNMVVVFTSSKFLMEPNILMKEYIIAAVESDTPLSVNTDGKTRLNMLVDNSKMPQESSHVPELPQLARTISGAKYKISESNDFGFTNFTLHFGLKKNVATMEFFINKNHHTVEAGLDGVYRVTELPKEKVAFKGEWLNKDTFKFSHFSIGHTERTSVEIKFIGNSADYTATGPYGDRFRFKGVRE
jgi:CubicO group peptidase (beta-lactamase class C family)